MCKNIRWIELVVCKKRTGKGQVNNLNSQGL